ncbi:HesB/IscA family protein [Niabella insulamsoli]|uniref:HesB/IscA family protein n=1 Tax=Niabella insulamsoli TaxID=3144874 RepID=UPI0031FC0A13
MNSTFSADSIKISDAAKARIEQILTEKNDAAAATHFVRVSVVSGGCSGLSYKLDFDSEEKPKDQIFEDNGVKIVTDMKSLLYLLGTTLDFSDGLSGKGFFFNNPNAARTCACGESFAV